MNFRYIALTVVMGVLYLAMLIKHLQHSDTIYAKIANKCIVILTAIMSVSSIILYGTIA